MEVHVLFFGATADQAGMRSLDLKVDKNTVVRTALAEMLNKFPQLKKQKLLFAVNREYDSVDRILNDGDELAIFTAVSGG